MAVTEVARRPGHGAAVLLKVYADCLDSQDGVANGHIAAALDDLTASGRLMPGDEVPSGVDAPATGQSRDNRPSGRM